MGWAKHIHGKIAEIERKNAEQQYSRVASFREISPMVKKVLSELGSDLYGSFLIFKNYTIKGEDGRYWCLEAKKPPNRNLPYRISVDYISYQGVDPYLEVSNGITSYRCGTYKTKAFLNEKSLKDALIRAVENHVNKDPY